MHARELWESRAFGPRIARAALWPAGLLYAAGWEGYLAMYRTGLKRAKSPHRPVVCVGNLAVGGSGKTPVVLHIADLLRDLGREVVIGMSGYGAPHAEAATVAPEGPLSAREWGDEPAMVRWLRPDIPLVVGRRRVLAAELVASRYPRAVLVMDDGFQHLPLAKQLTVVLDDAEPPNRWCLPAGPYREPRINRRRADIVLPDRHRVTSAPTRFQAADGCARTAPARFSVLCALGRPARFLADLEVATGSPGAPVMLLDDHDPMTAGTLLERLPADRPVVVTAKDWVKLRERPDVASRDFLIAMHQVTIEPTHAFRDELSDRLDERAP